MYNLYITDYIVPCLQIGLIGLVEYEWLATLSTISPEDVDYTDYVECAQLLASQLTAEVLHNLFPWCINAVHI